MDIDKLCKLCGKYIASKTTLMIKEQDLTRFLESWDKNSIGIKNKVSEIDYLKGLMEKTYKDIISEIQS